MKEQQRGRCIHTNGSTGRGDPDGNGFLRREVLRADGHARYKQTPSTKTDHDPLSQEDLVVLISEGSHHHTKRHQKGADDDELAEVAQIEDGPCEDADEKKQKALKGAHP